MPQSIFLTQDYRSFLSQTLTERCCRNKSYSLRAFARDLGAAPSLLCHLINGKGSLSLDKARAIAQKMNLKGHERDYFVALVEKEKTGSDSRATELRLLHAFQQISPEDGLDQDLCLDDFALLIKIGLLGGVRSLADSAGKLGIPAETLLSSCSRLQGLGWLIGNEREGWSALRGLVRTEAFSRCDSIRIFHRKVLELGLKLLDEGEVHERHFHSLVFSMNQSEYQEFCEDLHAFCLKKCDAYASRDSHDRVYTLGIQLLPVGRLERGQVSPAVTV